MSRSKHLALKTILSLLAVAAAFALGSNSHFYTEALTDAFFALALGSVLILHFRVRPAWADVLAVLGATSLFAAFDFGLLHYQPRFVSWFSFLGLASFLIMILRSVWSAPEERKLLLFAWVPALLFVLSDYFASVMLEWTAQAHPKTLDLYLFSVDSSMRLPFSFAMGRLFAQSPWLHNAGLICYVGLAIPIAVVYAGQLLRSRQKAFPAMLAFLITGPLGIVFYNIFPASGPHYVFHSFPAIPIRLDQVRRLILEPIAIKGPRNAIPSLHVAWTLLACWYSRGLSWFERLLAWTFLALTVVATLGTGEHWFVDLVVAVPFALMIEALCAYPLSWKDERRWFSFLLGALACLAWFALLRFSGKFFWTSPVVPWALVAATLGLACFQESRLANVQLAGGKAAAFAAIEPEKVPGDILVNRPT